MERKKDRARFTIKFNENDPMHKEVIGLLEKQGPRQKAQFIANAIFHYIHCSQTLEQAVRPEIDRAEIEAIVREMFNRRKMETEGMTPCIEQNSEGDYDMGNEEKADEGAFALISETMSAFRSM